MKRKLRVLVADDHAVVRAGLVAIFEYEDDLDIVGQAGDGEEAVRLADELSPDLVLMDLMMPRLDGAEATARIRASRPGTRVLVLTSSASLGEIRTVLDAGASGVLPKTVPNETLVESIRAVCRGERVLAPEFRGVDDLPAGPDLTDRQLEILRLLTKGLSNRDIAASFGISVGGVKRHLEQLFERLGASTRAEAVAIALREQLLKL